MTVRVQRSERSRHLFLRATPGDALPAALVAILRDERVSGGWLRASGVLTDVELSAFDGIVGRLGAPRRIAGAVQVLSLESSIGLVDGEPGLSLRAVLGRESDRGLETLAGEIVSARAIALEAIVTVFDDLALDRTLDAAVGVSLLDAPASPIPPAAARIPVPAARSNASSASSAASATGSPAVTWSAAAGVSAQTDRDAQVARSGANVQGAPMPPPQRPIRPDIETDQPTPEPGDVVDHFAFGRCEVIKSDGDRLHLRVPKDGRIREIALEMLRVIPLESEGPGRRFKLERRI
jgi:predicted DNA-binding protein with PD1-like motif